MKILKKLFITCSAATLLVGCANTIDNTSTSNSQKTTASVEAKHNLWAVKGKTNTVYLLGSIHVLTPDHYPLPEAYMEAYEDAERLVFEIEQKELDPTKLMKITQEMGVYLDGSKLSDYINPENYKKAKELFPQTGLPLQILDVMEPWMTYITVTSVGMEKHGYKAEYGVDKFFNNLATEENKPVTSLESVIQQMKMLDELPLETQTELLVKTLEEYNQFGSEMKKLDSAWVNADANFISKELIEEFKSDSSFYNALILDRNNNWMTQIKPMLEATDDFMVVAGAAHMYGDDGLVKQLKAAGYSVEQL